MRASEAIELLERLVQEHGDLVMSVSDDEGYFEAGDIFYRQASHGDIFIIW